jgi:CRP-like cAMP-binding protein
MVLDVESKVFDSTGHFVASFLHDEKARSCRDFWLSGQPSTGAQHEPPSRMALAGHDSRDLAVPHSGQIPRHCKAAEQEEGRVNKPINGADAAMRRKAMNELFAAGWTLEDMGAAWGITRERVRQIVNLDGAKIGGRTVRAIGKRMDRMANSPKHESVSIRVYGCGRARAIELNQGDSLSSSRSRAGIFRQYKTNCIRRGIPWELTFEEFCSFWDASGQWERRGRGKGKFCLARYGDSGPYALGNNYVAKNEDNASDSFLVKPKRDRKHLSARQIEVAVLLAEGLTPTQIGERLGISRATASIYSCETRQKLTVIAEDHS